MPSAVLTNPSGRRAPGTPASSGLSPHALASAWRLEAVQPSLQCAQYGSGFYRDRALPRAETIVVGVVGTFLRHSGPAIPFRLSQSAKGSAPYSATGRKQECLLPGRVVL